jgi:hypothetical protein
VGAPEIKAAAHIPHGMKSSPTTTNLNMKRDLSRARQEGKITALFDEGLLGLWEPIIQSLSHCRWQYHVVYGLHPKGTKRIVRTQKQRQAPPKLCTHTKKLRDERHASVIEASHLHQ